jgi:hypothetical protein
MSDFPAFLDLGVRHILDPGAADHLLFLLVLAAIYRRSEWRQGLWVVTAFTAGHSLTLALAVTNLLVLPSRWIEFLIPLTILATGVENLRVRDRARTWHGHATRALLAGGFGLVHGAGFANYLRALFLDRIAVPLLGFNIGIELAQIAVLAAAGVGLSTLDAALARALARAAAVPATAPATAHRTRIVAVSLVGIAWSAAMAVGRRPW